MVNSTALASVVLDTIAARYQRGQESAAGPIQLVLSDVEQRDWYIERQSAGCVVRSGRCDAPALSIETDTRTLAAVVTNSLSMTVPSRLTRLQISGSVAALARILFDSNEWIDVARERYANAEAACGETAIAEVERRQHLRLTVALEHAARSIPVVVERAIGLPSARDLSIASIAERFGTVTLMSQSNGTVALKDQFELIASSRTPRTDGHMLPAEILDALAWPEDWSRHSMRAALMFSSSEGALSTAHRHPNHVLNGQLAGRKLWRLYAPDQTPMLYVRPPTASHQMCQVETNTTDLAKYPLFRLAQPIQVTLEPGDVLVLPTGWYHEVIAVEPSVSCAFIVDDVPC